MSNDYIARIKEDGTDGNLYRYYFEGENKPVNNIYPEKQKRMQRMARGIYETTRYIRYNNTPKQVKTLIKELGLEYAP